MRDHLFIVTHQTAWLSIWGANNVFEFYGLLEVLTYTTDFCRQDRTYGIKSLQVELPLKPKFIFCSSSTQPGSLKRNQKQNRTGRFFFRKIKTSNHVKL